MRRHRSAVRALLALLLLGSACSSPAVEQQASEPGVTREYYGSAPQQFGDLTIPADTGPLPVVVLIHGGFWRSRFELDLMEPLAQDLAGRGFAVWNLEYRRVGQSDFAGTLGDVADGIDHLTVLAARSDLDLDLSRVGVVGHSAGGHLALWAGSRGLLGTGLPGAEPAVVPRVVVGQAPVADLTLAAADRLGGGAVQDFLGGEPLDVPGAYANAQPIVGTVYTVITRGSADNIIPASQVAVDPNLATVVEFEGEDHFTVIDPDSTSWARTVAELTDGLSADTP